MTTQLYINVWNATSGDLAAFTSGHKDEESAIEEIVDGVQLGVMDMDILIAELEAATEGSRKLDKSIYVALGLPITNRARLDPKMVEIHLESVAPHFSTSLDAAAMLVPEGMMFSVHQTPTDEGIERSAQVDWVPDGGAYAATPALALCVASLQACGAREDVDGGETCAGDNKEREACKP